MVLIRSLLGGNMRRQVNKKHSLHRSSQQGFAALVVIMIAGVLSTLSFYSIKFGRVAQRVSMEKQLLDSHGVIVGQQLIENNLDAVCINGEFRGDTKELSRALFRGLDGVNRRDREYTCEPLDGGQVIVREEGDPSGPPGTFRRYRVSSSYNGLSDLNDEDNPEDQVVRSVIVEVREINTELNRPRPQIMFLLDYSGSMNSNNRYERLKNAMNQFVAGNHEVDYGVVFFSSDVLETIEVGSGAAHDERVSEAVDSRSPGGSTNFVDPLKEAVENLNRTNNHYSYIVLISDGKPNRGGDPKNYVDRRIRNIDEEICRVRRGNKICHTIYTLGVDNADVDLLESLSGNAASSRRQRAEYTFEIASDNIEDAFEDITRDILCTFGPIEPVLEGDDFETLHVFLNGRSIPEIQNDDDVEGYQYDESTSSVRLFGQACSDSIDGQGELTLRYGKPRVIAEEALRF